MPGTIIEKQGTTLTVSPQGKPGVGADPVNGNGGNRITG